MYAKRKRRYWPLLLLLCLIGAGIGTTTAKYIYQQQMKGRITFTARLAEEIKLLEREAVSTKNDTNPDSNYKLTDKIVTSNTYFLMPGVDVPKDPYVQITGKTAIPSYLFIEILDTTNEAVSYTLDDKWKEVSDVNGQHGGKVYCYCNDGNYKLTNTGYMQVYVLKDGANAVVTVSETYLSKADADDVMTIYASLYEVFQTDGRDATPTEVYDINNS